MKVPDMDNLLGKPRAEAVFLGIACVATFLYRGAGFITTLAGGVPQTSHISYDGVFYAQIARNILEGDGLGWEAMIFPVLQPLLTALLSLVTGIGNLAFLASCISQVAGVLLLIPVYYLTREIYGRGPAAASVLILIPYPHLAAMAGADTAESLYAFLVFLSLALGYKALESRSPLYLGLTGLGMGFTYLARPEGLILFWVFLGLAAWRLLGRVPAREAVRGLGLLVAGFLFISIPYAAFLTKSYGRVVLSPKLPYESIVMKQKVFNEPLKMSEVEGLTENGEIVWREKGGAGIVLGYFKEDPVRFVRVYLENLASELPWEVRNSSHLAGYPIVYPVYLWAFALLAFALLVSRPDTRWKALLIWAPFFNLFIYPVFSKGFWIYHAPYVPGLVILAVGGVATLSDAVRKRLGFALPLLLVMVLGWTGYSVYVKLDSKPHEVEVVNFKTILSEESRKAGEWGRQNIGRRSAYMMEWSRLVYYLGGRWVALPASDPDRVVEYGIRSGADYIVEELVGERAIEGPRFQGVANLEFINMYSSSKAPYIVIFWKINKAGALRPGGPG